MEHHRKDVFNRKINRIIATRGGQLRRVIKINISSVGISESSISTSGGTRIGVPPKEWAFILGLKAPPKAFIKAVPENTSFCQS